jgi:glucose-6-phosphate 1-dehydrogenase
MGETVELLLTEDTTEDMTPYERLLGDAMEGENLLFAREDGVEAAWRVVNDVLTDHHEAFPYARQTWGPSQAEALIDDPDHWHNPEMT